MALLSGNGAETSVLINDGLVSDRGCVRCTRMRTVRGGGVLRENDTLPTGFVPSMHDKPGGYLVVGFRSGIASIRSGCSRRVVLVGGAGGLGRGNRDCMQSSVDESEFSTVRRPLRV